MRSSNSSSLVAAKTKCVWESHHDGRTNRPAASTTRSSAAVEAGASDIGPNDAILPFSTRRYAFSITGKTFISLPFSLVVVRSWHPTKPFIFLMNNGVMWFDLAFDIGKGANYSKKRNSGRRRKSLPDGADCFQ